MPNDVIWKGSPNFESGRAGYRPIGIVVHIMQGTFEDTDSWFGTTRSQVSAHYGVGRDGTVHQYVREGDTAWHAGRVSDPTWTLIKIDPSNGRYVNPNFYTIGVEHEGHTGNPWTTQMLSTSASLIAELANRWAIPLDRQHVIGHCEIYSKKAFCPGTGVDLDALIAAAAGQVSSPATYPIVSVAGTTTAVAALNIRQAPTRAAAVTSTVPPGTRLDYDGWTGAGESVHGNSHWYRDPSHGFFWAGGTARPLPI